MDACHEAEAPTQGHRRVWDVTEAEKVDVSAVASSGNLVMLAAMRRASLWVSSLASGGFLPTSRFIPVNCIVDHWPLSDLPDRLTRPSRLNAKVMQGLFLLRERQRACSSRHAAGAALLLLVTLLPGCSDVALADEMPASEPDPGYNNLVAKHLKDTFKNRASYDAFAISAFRWVHSFKGPDRR